MYTQKLYGITYVQSVKIICHKQNIENIIIYISYISDCAILAK